MRRQSRSALSILVPKRRLVEIESPFECLRRQAGVLPLVFSGYSYNSGLVDHREDLAHAVQWATVFFPTVAWFLTGRVYLNGSRTPYNWAVMRSDDGSRIRQATVTLLKHVGVEDFVQF